ncbi:Gfo/Idh/MocA family protein [Phytohabitans flavus]|uniref:Gfo/Idh/MocA family protein n=1 Tax=Phytohabitans flavus TaxID=1076124 RepID=UPI00363D2D36
MAVIGCGDMEDAHQQVFAGLGDRITVIGTADVVLARAEHAAQALGAPRAVTDYTELLDDADACLIVTPHDLHYEMGMRCLRAGKHVLMEKPMAVSEEQCLDLIHAASTAERQLMTAYPMRFHPLVAHLRELVAAEAYGEVIQVSVYTEQHTEHPEGHWIRSAARLGGGQLFSHGCHYVDLLLWMLGEPVRGTHTGTRRGTPWMEWEGTSNAVIEFASGALGYHFGTWGARATRHGYAIHVHCEKGMLEADLTRGLLYAHHPWAGEARAAASPGGSPRPRARRGTHGGARRLQTPRRRTRPLRRLPGQRRQPAHRRPGQPARAPRDLAALRGRAARRGRRPARPRAERGMGPTGSGRPPAGVAQPAQIRW